MELTVATEVSVDPAIELLATADRALRQAEREVVPIHRFELAYLAALRSAAAVLACRAKPRNVRTKPRGIWALLIRSAPELREWADFFAQCGYVGAAINGTHAPVSSRQADDLVRDASTFLSVARGCVAYARN